MSNGIKRSQLRSFQKWGIDRIYDNEITILAWDMGAGKSVTVLTAADDLLEDRVIKKWLIVAPMLVACATYPDEFFDWKHLNHIDYTLIRAEDEDEDIIAAYKDGYEMARLCGLTPAEASKWAGKHRTRAKEWKRRRLVSDGAEVHIINKEGLPWLWNHFGDKWPYDGFIVDEASVFKNGKRRTATKEVSIFGAAAKARKFVKRIVLMTGTPTPKGLRNMWGLAYIADLGERLGTARTKFEDRWFDKDYMGWNLTPKPHAQEEITRRMSDVMFTLDPDLYPDLPPLLIKDTRVTLPKKVMVEYHRFKATLVSEAYDIEAVNNGVLASKLLQFAAGAMYDENGKDVWVHDKKFDALDEIIQEADGEPVLVAYNFKFELARLKKKYPKAVVFGEGDVRKTKADWNAGNIPLMFAHPQSVGHGQNIQFGGNILVWLSLCWDLEIYQQMCKRLHRPGQKRPVTMYHIIAKGTYDEDILPRLKDRAETQDEIMAALRLDLLSMKRHHDLSSAGSSGHRRPPSSTADGSTRK